MIDISMYICTPTYGEDKSSIYVKEILGKLDFAIWSSLEFKSFWNGEYYSFGMFEKLPSKITPEFLEEMKQKMFKGLMDHHFGLVPVPQNKASFSDTAKEIIDFYYLGRAWTDSWKIRQHINSVISFIEGYENPNENGNFYVERMPF